MQINFYKFPNEYGYIRRMYSVCISKALVLILTLDVDKFIYLSVIILVCFPVRDVLKLKHQLPWLQTFRHTVQLSTSKVASYCAIICRRQQGAL